MADRPKITDWDQLMNQARVKLLGASDAGIKGELFDVLHEFFEFTNWWTEALQFSIVLPDPSVYELAPTGGQIIRLIGVVDPNNVGQAAILGDDLTSIQFAHQFNTAQVMTAVVAKSVVTPPDRSGFPIVPAGFLQRWHTVVLSGLLGAMMGTIAKSYSNETGSTYHLRRFQNGKSQAKVEKLHRSTVGVQSWTFPGAFSSGTQRGGTSLGNDLSFKV